MESVGRPLILMSFGVKEVFCRVGSRGRQLEVMASWEVGQEEGLGSIVKSPVASSPFSHGLVPHHSPLGVIPLKPRMPPASPRVFFLWLRWYLQ